MQVEEASPTAEVVEDPYVTFWEDVGDHFPSLKGAASTRYYFACEQWLFQRFFGDLRGRSILKTDLWDEAKNSDILRWATAQGACPFGVDLAFSIAREARTQVWARPPGLAVGDVRQLPFRDNSLDLIYSMGTIEHFDESDVAVAEFYRVLKPGGSALIGVPNKLDPFLRPLMVSILNAMGQYAYGREKSYTPRGLQQMLESAGFDVRGRSGILFIPGWLRMLDLVLHTRAPALQWLTWLPVELFSWLYRTMPAVRRHGYLIACLVTKPVHTSSASRTLSTTHRGE